MNLSTFSRFFANLGLGRSERKPQRRAKRRPAAKPTLEFLEDRTLLSTSPAAVVTNPNTSPYYASTGFAPASGFDPQIVMDPTNSQNLVAVYTTGTALGGATSTDGGQSWKAFTFTSTTGPAGVVFDPTQFNNAAYADVTSPSVSFDRDGNFYVVSNQFNATALTLESNTTSGANDAGASGAIVFDKFNFAQVVGGAGSATAETVKNSILYQWEGQDPAYNPTVAVDTNLPATATSGPSFTDPVTGATQTDTMAVSIDPTTGLVVTAPAAQETYKLSTGGGITAATATFTVTGGNGTTVNPPANALVTFEDTGEQVFLTSATGSPTTGSSWTVTRGVNGTTAIGHANGATLTYSPVAAKGVYVGWNINFTMPQFRGSSPATVSRIMIAASGDGGNNFTTNQYADTAGSGIVSLVTAGNGTVNIGAGVGAAPEFLFTQGTTDTRVTGGQLNVLYSTVTGAAAAIQQSQPDGGVAANAVAASATFTNSTGGNIAYGNPAGFQTETVFLVDNVNGFNGLHVGDTEADVSFTAGTTLPGAGATVTIDAGQANAETVTLSSVNQTSATTATFGFIATPVTHAHNQGEPMTYRIQTAGASSQTTDFNLPVSSTLFPADFTTIDDLEVTVAMVAPHMDQMSIVLIPPVGSGLGNITLLDNFENTNGSTNFATGLPDLPNLGVYANPTINPNGQFHTVGTVFDADAPRNIDAENDNTSTAPWIGHFQPELGGGNGNNNLTEVNGLTPAAVNGTWVLSVTDFINQGNNPPQQFLTEFSMHFTSLVSTSGFGAGADTGGAGQPPYVENGATQHVALAGALAGSPSNVYSTSLGAGATGTPGAGPGVVAAVDNTLGQFSPFQGRFYIAYTTGTSILVLHSDNDAVAWTAAGVKVNDDAIADNFSEGSRPEFLPSIAVDPVTGTLVVAYYDGRWDAATARVGNSISYSVNGGENWSTSASMNLEQTSTDEITSNTVDISPILGNTTQAGTFGFGDRAGLVAYDGDVMPFFGSNLNAAGSEIMTATVTIPSGPTVVSGDMGPIVTDSYYTPTVYTDSTYTGTALGGTYGPITYNNTFASDGTRQLSSFEITFDRPIDISTFTTGLIQVFFRDPEGDAPVQIPVASITALDNQTGFGPAGIGVGGLATQFLINLMVPQFLVGTYSYAIGLSEWSLASPIAAGDTFLTVKSGGLIPPTGPFNVTLDQETMTVTSVNNTTNVWQVIRGVGGTTNAAHAAGDNIITVPLSTDIRSIATGVTLNNHAGLTEQWTLAAPMLSTDTSLQVSPNGPFINPSASPFLITIDQETMTVTSVNNVTNVWQVTRGASAAAHAAGANVSFSGVTELAKTTLDMPNGALLGATSLTVHHYAAQQPPAPGALITFADGTTYTILSTTPGAADDTWTLTTGLTTGEANGAAVTYTAGAPVLLGSFMNQDQNVITNAKQVVQAPGVNTITSSTNNTPTPLPGAGTPTPSPIITFTDPYQQVRQDFYDPIQVRVDLGVDTSITSSLALTVALVSPNGTTVNLGPATFAETNNGVRSIIFTDYTPATVPTGAVYHKSVTPLLAALVNENVNGGWQLVITNNNGGSSGNGALVKLLDWSLTLPVTTNVFAVPNPINGVPFQFPYTNQTLPLIIPGPHVVSTAVVSPGTYNVPSNVYDQWSLATTISFTANSLTVTAGGPSLPPGPFTILIGSEEMEVSPTSATVWTILARHVNGTSAAPHGAGAVITYAPNVAVAAGATLNVTTNTTQLVLPVTDAFQVQQSATNQIQVTVRFTAAAAGSVKLLLKAQDGTTVNLGTVAAVLGVNTFTFDDFAPNGTVAPATPLATLIGENTAGDWRLAVDNSVAGHAGALTVTYWTLELPHTTGDNEVLNSTASGLLVTFDRDMNPSTFTAGNVVQLIDPLGDPIGATGLSEATFPGNFSIIADPSGTPAALAKRVFEVVFPTEQLNGTYTLDLSPSIQDTHGNAVDTNLNAGIDVLNGDSTTNTVNAVLNRGTNGNLNFLLQPGTQSVIPFTITQSFQIQQDNPAVSSSVSASQQLLHHIEASLNIQAATGSSIQSSDFQAELIAPDGTAIQLFTNVGGADPSSQGFTQGFQNTIFDDFASNPIQAGTPPYSDQIGANGAPATFNPQDPLSVLAGKNTAGTWQLVVTNTSSADIGALEQWAMQFPYSVPDTNLGEPQADQISASFRIFNQDASNLLTQQQWTPVGPAPDNNGANTGPVNAIAVDPSDPSGNTVYVAAASGGLWKTTNFLTTNPLGPTYIPLTNLGPTGSLNISSVAIIGVNNDPSQSIIIAMTGNPNTNNPPIPGNIDPTIATGGNPSDLETGIGMLWSDTGGRTWTVLDSSHNFWDPANGGTTTMGQQNTIDNPLPESDTSPVGGATDVARDHLFVGLVGYKVTVDPTPLPSGTYVVYAAFSNGPNNTNGGLYRSVDAGADWTIAPAPDSITGHIDLFQGAATPMQPGAAFTNATDVVLAAGSADTNGNLQQLYAAFQGQGVYGTSSATSAQSLNQLSGAQGDASRQNVDFGQNFPQTVGVTNPPSTPNGGNGRIVLAAPSLTSSPVENSFYEGWLYAAVANNAGNGLTGLYVTKDFGANWTKIQLPQITTVFPVFGTNNTNDGSINSLQDPLAFPFDGGGTDNQITGITYLTLTVDPTNPNIVYLGGAGSNLLRIDISNLADPYAAVPYTNIAPNGTTTQFASTGPATLRAAGGAYGIYNVFAANPYAATEQGPSGSQGYYNLVRDPANLFDNPSTLQMQNITNINNQGTGALWGEIGNLTNSAGVSILSGSIGLRALVAFRDPLTGDTRLLVGDDNGVFTGADFGVSAAQSSAAGSSPTFNTNPTNADQSTRAIQSNIGSAQVVTGSRNGNLQIADMADSAAQPSSLAANIAGALFYGVSQFNNGFPQSTSTILSTGNLNWTGVSTTGSFLGDGTSVATDLSGSGQLYQDRWANRQAINQQSLPSFLFTDFFLVTPPQGQLTSRNGGAGSPLTPTDQGQWPSQGGSRFAVNPVDPTGIVISSQSPSGSVYRSYSNGPNSGTGKTWAQIAQPGLSGSYGNALAFGAPNPSVDANVDDFIYDGTLSGKVFVTFSGGGANSSWTNITGAGAGALDGSAVEQIVTDPNQGTHDLFAVTQKGVYYMADSTGLSAPIAWTNITGNLFSLQRPILNNPRVPNNLATTLVDLTSLAVDWRFTVPTSNPAYASGTVPVLYVGGTGGVFRSQDGGTTWTNFPSITESWTLASALSATATTLTVNANGPTPPAGKFTVTIGQEELTVTSVVANTWTVLRGQDGTTAAAHSASATLTNNGDGAVEDGGNFPNLQVTSLQLMTGNINPQTGLPDSSTGYNMLMASTYGQGDFVIRLDNSAVSQFSVGEAVADFPVSGPGSGVYVYHSDSGFQQIAQANASVLAIDSSGDVAAEFPGYGVYEYTAKTRVLKLLTQNNASVLTIDSLGDVFAEFPQGVYRYTAATGVWTQLTPSNATLLSADARGDLFAEFPHYGVMEYVVGSGFMSVNGADASLLAADGAGDAFAFFSGTGLAKYTGGTWTVLNGSNVSQLAVDPNGDAAVVFPGFGTYRLLNTVGSTFVQLTTNTAVSGLAIGGNGDVFAEFPGSGLWRNATATGWQQLTLPQSVSLPTEDFAGDVFVQVSGLGIMRFTTTGGWQALPQSAAPSLLAADKAGDVVAEFAGYGVYFHASGSANWTLLLNNTASQLGIDAAGDVFAVFPQGLYRHAAGGSSWVQLTAAHASLMAVDANGDIAANFPVAQYGAQGGVYRYTASLALWQQVKGNDASLLAIDAAGDIFASLSTGVWRFLNGGASQLLNGTVASQLTVDATGDLVVQFQGFSGVYLSAFGSPTAFQQIATANASLLANDIFGDVFIDFVGEGFYRFTANNGLQLLPGTEGDASVLA